MAQIQGISLIEILTSLNQEIYIPIYQRNYCWNDENTSKLVKDIWEFKSQISKFPNITPKYYLGSMIYKKITATTQIQYRISLVDGQQRMTTILLILKAISTLEPNIINFDKFVYSNPDPNNKNRRFRICRRNSSETLKNIFLDKEVTNKESVYYKNFLTIKNTIKNNKINPISLYKTIKNVDVAWIMLEPYEDESSIFERINSTGKPLTNADLIKNYIFSKADQLKTRDEEELIEIYHNRIEDIFQQKGFNENDFFRYYVSIHDDGKLPNRNGKDIFFVFKKIIEELKMIDLTQYDALKTLIKDIQKTALIFSNATIFKQDECQNIADMKIILCKKILSENTSYFPMYYSLINEGYELRNNALYKKKNLNNDFKEYDILILISKYYFFRQITGRLDKNITRDIPRFFIKYREMNMNNISLKGFEKYLVESINVFDQQMPKISDVLKCIGDISYANRQLAKNILIAAEIGCKKINSTLTKIDSINIEHIFPQNSNTWRNHFENLQLFIDFDSSKDNIKNLTILNSKLNTSVSNLPFKEKKARFFSDSVFAINKIIEKYDEYNYDLLNERLKFIIENFAKFYNVNFTYTSRTSVNNLTKIPMMEKNESNFAKFKQLDKEMQEKIRNIENSIKGDFYIKKPAAELQTIIEHLLRENNNSYHTSLFDLIEEKKDSFPQDVIDNLHNRLQGNDEVHSVNDKAKNKAHLVRLLHRTYSVMAHIYNKEIDEFDSSIYYTNYTSPKYIYKKDSNLVIDTNNEKNNNIHKNNANRTRQSNEYLKSITRTLKENKNNVNIQHDIFNYVPLRLTPSKGYVENIELFDKEKSKGVLKLYLFSNMSGESIDKQFTNGSRNKGWITACTLAYLRIETNGKARGSLKELAKEKATKLINDFVDENY